MSQKKSVKIGLSVAVILLLVGYAAGLFIFQKYSYPNTFVNDDDRGLVPMEELLIKKPTDRTYTFEGMHGEKLSVTKDDIDLDYRIVKEEHPKRNVFLWPLEIIGRKDYHVEHEMEYDERKLDFLIRESDFDPEGTVSQDAYIEIDGSDVRIVPEVFGTKIDEAKFEEIIANAFTTDEEVWKVEDIYTYPEKTKDDTELLAKKAQLEEMFANRVVLDLKDRTYALEGETLLGMMDISGEKPVVDEEMVRDWVGEIARETDTFGRTRSFLTTSGQTIDVNPGIYGWQMNVAGTVDEILDLLEEGGDYTIQPHYNIYGYERATDDIGGTYIEVDLSKQHLWAYKDGVMVFDDDIVSGNVSVGKPTPVGVNAIWSREVDQILRGESFTGAEYASPVDYWMPINWNGVGFHDADWIPSFGGDYYLNHGSNGCLNLSQETAQAMYETFQAGTPVVIYESSTDYSPHESI